MRGTFLRRKTKNDFSSRHDATLFSPMEVGIDELCVCLCVPRSYCNKLGSLPNKTGGIDEIEISFGVTVVVEKANRL